MENHHSSGSAAPAPPNAKGGSGPSGSPENKDVAMANLGSAAEVVAATVVATSTDGGNDVSKGKSVVAAADNEEVKPHIIAERKRRAQMRDYFGELQALIPQIPEKSDKVTIVEHAIDYIQSLEKTKAMLEKRNQELVLARQAAGGVEAAASSSSAPPLIAQGMAPAAMSLDGFPVPDACSDVPPPLQPGMPMPALPQLLPVTMSLDVPQPVQQPPAAVEPAPALPPQQLPVATAGPVAGFQTWSWPELVLSVSNDNAYLSVCAPRHRGMWTMAMVLSVLDKYGIDVVTAQVDSDAVHTIFNIYASVTPMGGENPSALQVYHLAVSEILVWLTTS